MSGAGRARLPGSVSAARLPLGSAFLPSEMGGGYAQRDGRGGFLGAWLGYSLWMLEKSAAFKVGRWIHFELLVTDIPTALWKEDAASCGALGAVRCLAGAQRCWGSSATGECCPRHRLCEFDSSEPTGSQGRQQPTTGSGAAPLLCWERSWWALPLCIKLRHPTWTSSYPSFAFWMLIPAPPQVPTLRSWSSEVRHDALHGAGLWGAQQCCCWLLQEVLG